MYYGELCRTKKLCYTKIAKVSYRAGSHPERGIFYAFWMKKQEESISEEVLFFCPEAFVWNLRSVSFMTHETRIQWGIAT